jgi:outer membrane protein
MKSKYLLLSIGFAVGSFQTNFAQVQRVSLREALETAAANNKQIQIRKYEQMAAMDGIREARASYLPTVSASGSYSYFFDRQVIFMPGSFVGDEKRPVVDVAVGGRNAFNGYISAIQPVLNLTSVRQTELAKISADLKQQQLEAYQNLVALDISKQYLYMLLLAQQIKQMEQSLHRNEKALEDARNFYMQGKSLKTDTLNSFVAVQNVRAAISVLLNEREITELRFKRLTGIDIDARIELSDTLLLDTHQNIAPSLANGLTTALSARKDLHIEELNLQLRKKDEQLQRSLNKPQLVAIGQYQVQAQTDHLADKYSWPPTSFVGVQLSLPIYAGNRYHLRQRIARYSVLQQDLRLTDAREVVSTELSGMYKRLEDAKRQKTIAQESVQAAELSYIMMGDRFSNGLSSRLDLSDTELMLTKAKINLLMASYLIRVLEYDILNATGQLSL